MIDNTALAMLVARDLSIRESHSSRPDAPVVDGRPHRVRPRGAGLTVRTRAVLAAVLHRTADAVAPSCPPQATAH